MLQISWVTTLNLNSGCGKQGYNIEISESIRGNNFHTRGADELRLFMTQHLGIKDLLKHPPGLPSRHSSACRVLSTPCYLLCSPLCYPRISLKGAARYGKYVRSHWRTAAASLPFALPLAGTLNAAASMHGHSIAAAQHSPEEAEHGSLVGVDPRAPGENITVVICQLMQSAF